MKNYFPVTFTDLNIIQEKVLSSILTHTNLKTSKFFYIPIRDALNIKELKNQINSLNLLKYIHSAAINIYPKGISPIHTDTNYGDFKFSLNIPISGYTNTYLNYFEAHAEPKITVIERSVNFIEYDRESCTLIEKHETITPAIVNTNIPHSFDNPNDYTRIMLLLRLNKTFNGLAGLAGVEPTTFVSKTKMISISPKTAGTPTQI